MKGICMRKSISILLTAFVAALPLLAVPVYSVPEPEKVFTPGVKVGLVSGMTIDNAMASPLWDKVPAYHFMRYVTELTYINRAPAEGAKVRYLANENTLFVRVDMTDSDVMTSGTTDQSHHYLEGDVLEVFVKPLEHPYYWEIYGTPNKLYTRFYFPAKGTLGLPSGFGPTDVKVGVDSKVEGTFNNHSDRDKGWSVIIAIPKTELEKNGCKFAPGTKWTILAARYNYTCHLPQHELSSFPQITGGYHSTNYYANIEFVNINMEKK